MDLTPGNAQWQGTRSEQQDAFGFLGFDHPDLRSHGGVLLVLADGMGGMSSGGRASRLAVERMMAAYATKTPDEPIPRALERALQAANQAVYELACASEGEGEVGTTLVAVSVRGAELNWVSVGDSRLYHYRAGDDAIAQCTDDHTLVNEHLRKLAVGAADPGEAPQRDALVSYLGLAQIPEIDRNRHPLHLAPGDRVLLCSDGIHGVLEEAAIRTLLRGDSQGAAEGLIAAVRAEGRESQDNATAAILALDGAGERTRRSPRLGVPSAADERPKKPIAMPLMAAAAIVLAALIGYWLWMSAGTPAGPGQTTDETGSPPTGTPPSAPGAGSEGSGRQDAAPGASGGQGEGADVDKDEGADASAPPATDAGQGGKDDRSAGAHESNPGASASRQGGGGRIGKEEPGANAPGPTVPANKAPAGTGQPASTPSAPNAPAQPMDSYTAPKSPEPSDPAPAPQPRTPTTPADPPPAKKPVAVGHGSQASEAANRSTEREHSEASPRH